MINTQPVKIVGLAQALENAQQSALEYANAIEREIVEKGLDAVVKRLQAKHSERICEENKMQNQNKTVKIIPIQGHYEYLKDGSGRTVWMDKKIIYSQNAKPKRTRQRSSN